VKTQTGQRPVTTEEALGRIKRGLVSRSGKDWTVKLSRGSSFGWICIASPSKRRGSNGLMNYADSTELTGLLSLKALADAAGVLIPCRDSTLKEFIMRAEGLWR
jgi:hypothetical protein